MSTQGNLRRSRNDKDYISELPDTILCFILSFFPTKFVIQTSILSKRWKYLWTKVPALDFAHYNEECILCKDMMFPIDYCSLCLKQQICFKSFMEKVLFHNNVSYVQRFCLNLRNANFLYVNSWLTAASRRQIHEININLMNSSLRISLPSRLISQEKLLILKLEGRIILSDLNISQLPNLETLHLKNIKFSEHGVLMRLCNSPALKELHIDRCYGLPNVFNVVSLTLKSLTLKQDYEGTSCFVIMTPNINYICLDGKLSQYYIEDAGSLIEAHLDVVYDDDVDGDDNGRRAQELLKKISGVKILDLGGELILGEMKLSFFENLTYLKVVADMIMMELLERAPKLKTLVIEDLSDFNFPLESLLAIEHLPCLETIELFDLYGEDEEFVMIAHFLKVASALKELKFKELCCNEDNTAAYERVLNMPRSSPICQIYVGKCP